MIVSEVFTASVTDWLISSGKASLFAVRSVASAIAGVGCAACLAGVTLQDKTVRSLQPLSLLGHSCGVSRTNVTCNMVLQTHLLLSPSICVSLPVPAYDDAS